jgi:subtilisin family serine protease
MSRIAVLIVVLLFAAGPAAGSRASDSAYGRTASGEAGAALRAAGVPAAWRYTRGSPRLLVAIVDGAVDVAHPDLAAAIWRNPGEVAANGIDDDGDGFVDDVRTIDLTTAAAYDPRHGTGTAGVIAGRGGRGGVVGVAPRVKLLPVIALDSGALTPARVARAIDIAVAEGARVINVSIGFAHGDRRPLVRAIDRAAKHDVLIVAAAGNFSLDLARDPRWPAAARSRAVLTVAALGRKRKVADWSNYSRRLVDLAAPARVRTTVPGGYETLTGTSEAAPIVAGIAALYRSRYPHATVDQVCAALTATAKPAVKGVRYGAVRAGAAVRSRPRPTHGHACAPPRRR